MAEMLPYYLSGSVIITIIIETLLAVILGVRKKWDIITIILVQIATNPLVNIAVILVQRQYGIEGRYIAVVISEIFAFVSEALVYKFTLNYRKINPFLLSLILNGASYTTGVLISLIS